VAQHEPDVALGVEVERGGALRRVEERGEGVRARLWWDVLVDEDGAVGDTPVGPDPEPFVEHLKKYAEAGYTSVCMHQIGPDQEGFIRFWEKELRPAWESVAAG
jgi:hypothetical protein